MPQAFILFFDCDVITKFWLSLRSWLSEPNPFTMVDILFEVFYVGDDRGIVMIFNN